MAIQVIDTSISKRHVSVTTAHVETDIVDASGNYKPFAEYDTIKYVVDPSVQAEVKRRRMDHLYVDPSINEIAWYEFEHYYSTSDGKLDRSKFPF